MSDECCFLTALVVVLVFCFSAVVGVFLLVLQFFYHTALRGCFCVVFH